MITDTPKYTRLSAKHTGPGDRCAIGSRCRFVQIAHNSGDNPDKKAGLPKEPKHRESISLSDRRNCVDSRFAPPGLVPLEPLEPSRWTHWTKLLTSAGGEIRM